MAVELHYMIVCKTHVIRYIRLIQKLNPNDYHNLELDAIIDRLEICRSDYKKRPAGKGNFRFRWICFNSIEEKKFLLDLEVSQRVIPKSIIKID
jgi:hypothetical protein